MTDAQSHLLGLLDELGISGAGKLDTFRVGEAIEQKLFDLAPKHSAELLILSAFTATAAEAMREQYWLRSQNQFHPDLLFSKFLESEFVGALLPIAFLRPVLNSHSLENLGTVVKLIMHKLVRDSKRDMSVEDFRLFSGAAVIEMAAISNVESMRLQSLEEGAWKISLYRAFDVMDEIFGLDYSRDIGMKNNEMTSERLYEGAGLGVQTSYSSLLMAIQALQIKPAAKLVDLGSGYGRLGLLMGLLRPDIEFTGYEFVGHRVEVANNASLRLGLERSVHFCIQDLSIAEFAIPEADVYYMYDPFTGETYNHVFGQLEKISREKSITIVTKGNAGAWMKRVTLDLDWAPPLYLDDGTVSIFKSPYERRV
jgi:hypothetical protein